MSSSSEADPILVSYHDSIVRSSNLKTLDQSNWLDDNIITFAFEYLQHASKYTEDINSRLFTFVTPPVVQLIKMSDDLFAEQLLQSIDFLEKKFVILPINDNTLVTQFGGSHWSLLIFSVEEKILLHFDSMSSANDQTAKNILGKFRVFLHEKIPLINGRCPQQTNGFDCGLYVIAIVEEFCRFVSEENHPKDFWEKFSHDIHQHVTSNHVDQRRKQLKSLLESMSNERKK